MISRSRNVMEMRSRKNPVLRPSALLLLIGAFACLAGCAARAADSTIRDEWDVISLSGLQVGYDHTITRKVAEPKPMIVTSTFSETRIKDFGATLVTHESRGRLRDARRRAAPRDLFRDRRGGERLRGAGPGRQADRDHAYGRDDARHRDRLGPAGASAPKRRCAGCASRDSRSARASRSRSTCARSTKSSRPRSRSRAARR